MSSKKLQTEIDRTLKKVTEGLEIFHETLDKLNSATTPNQKEKYEVDLKKEIKKLQRLRDTIKGWQSSSEIKDKQPINDARKAIEAQMERFKVLEKEMKIKAFSKEGLNQATKLDPKMREKLELASWINCVVDKLNTQIDAYDAEVETMMLGLKKGKKLESSKQSRNDLLVKMSDKHKNHIKKLEAILRLMENDEVSTEMISTLKDEIDYYVESNLEDDFVENDEIYADFDFSSAPETDSDSEYSDSDRDEPVLRKKSIESSTPPVISQISPTAATATITSTFKTTPSPTVNTSSSGVKSPPAVVIPPKPATVAPSVKEMDSFVKIVSPPPPPPGVPQPQQQPIQSAPSTKIVGPSFASALAAATAASSSTLTSGSLSRTASKESISRIFEELDSFLAKKFPADALKNETLAFMTASYQNLPENHELDRNRQYSPKHPYAMPSYYQAEPPQILSNPSIFERFDLDTLFFIFYYQQKTYPQYLAARELKKQSWRFHKKYLTWFQRHEEPNIITTDYEQGTYIYFDYEGSWCQRKKSEFTFEYRYLEDEELV